MQTTIVEAKAEQGMTLLNAIRTKYPGYHPILAMADIAHEQDASPDLKFNCHKTIAKYILPELKSVEVNMRTEQERRVTVSLFDEPQMIQDAEIIGETIIEAEVLQVAY